MIRSCVLLTGLMLFAAGCGVAPTPIADPIAVTGKATLSGGAPASGVSLTLQPLEAGHMTMLEIGPDGSFSGEATPGKYAYFVAPSQGKKINSLERVPAKYREADMARTVTVADGQPLQIQLD